MPRLNQCSLILPLTHICVHLVAMMQNKADRNVDIRQSKGRELLGNVIGSRAVVIRRDERLKCDTCPAYTYNAVNIGCEWYRYLCERQCHGRKPPQLFSPSDHTSASAARYGAYQATVPWIARQVCQCPICAVSVCQFFLYNRRRNMACRVPFQDAIPEAPPWHGVDREADAQRPECRYRDRGCRRTESTRILRSWLLREANLLRSS